MAFSDKSLNDLAKNVFSDKYEFVKGPVQVKGDSGKSWTFDAVVKNNLNTFGVFIRDWKREISITQLRQLHKACIDTSIQGGIMVCNIITDFSRDYSSQFWITTTFKGSFNFNIKTKEIPK